MNKLLKDSEDSPKPFIEHLEELRVAIVRCVVCFAVAFAIAVPLAPTIMRLLRQPLVGLVADPDAFLRSIEVVGAFAVIMRIAGWGGLIMSAPFLLIFTGAFVFPGLKLRERKAIVYSLGFSIGLFMLGVMLGYRATLPVALRIMLRMHAWLGVDVIWTVGSYVAFCMHLLIGFGLAFQLPVIILVLGRMGIVRSRMLRDKRPHVIVALLILAMLLTPPDVVTQLMMAVPLAVLYEACIWILYATEKKQRQMHN